MAKIAFQTEPIEAFYYIREELGRGNFAIVKRCQHKENGVEYAAKCITKKRSKTSKRGMSKEAVEIEAGVLMALEHEAIIKLYDVFETRTNITLVMELLTGGELFEEIAKEEFILEKDACFYVKQILSAIRHMHSQNIVHLDLKPENIVLKYPGSKEIKLIDFGLAKILDPDKELREMMGTPEFSAPEVINYDPVGPFTDMWAIGVVTYVLLSGASPFLGDDDQETYHNITSCDYQFDDEYFEKITENAKDFIRKLLIKKSNERNTIDDCLDHPWIAFEDEENSVIDTQKMRAFVARRRWKQSLKLVATISRLKMLCRNSTPSPPSEASGDEDGNGTDESTRSNSGKGQEGKLKNFTASKLFSNIIGSRKNKADSTAERNMDVNSQKVNGELISPNKEGKETSGEEDGGTNQDVVQAQNEKDISSSNEEDCVDKAVFSNSKNDAGVSNRRDNGSSSTHEETLQNSSVASEQQDIKIEGSADLSLMDNQKPVVCNTSDIEPCSQGSKVAAQVLLDGSSAVEYIDSNNEVGPLNDNLPQDTARITQNQFESLPSGENPVKLKASVNADCDDQDAMTKSQRCSLFDGDNEEDVKAAGLQGIEDGNVEDSKQRDLLDASSNGILKEQNVFLPKQEIVSSRYESNGIQVESNSKNSKQEVGNDDHRTIIVEQNISKSVVFKLDMNVSQHPKKTGSDFVEHAEVSSMEKSVGGKFIIKAVGSIATQIAQDASTISLPGTSGNAEKLDKTNSVSDDNSQKENIEANSDSKRTVVSKAFTEITVNGDKAKKDNQGLQNFSSIKVGIPFPTEKALDAMGLNEELHDSPVTREVTVENDDEMVVIEMIHPRNNNN